jgi:hypothetical protein
MPLNRYSVVAAEVEQRIRTRLLAGSPPSQTVAWGDYRGSIELHLGSLKAVIKDGWLLCNLDANAAGASPGTLQFIFYLGREQDANGTTAAGTINAPGEAALALAREWGPVVQRVIWDGVLDVIEGVVNYAAKQSPNRPLTLLGFQSTEGQLHVEVQTADAA